MLKKKVFGADATEDDYKVEVPEKPPKDDDVSDDEDDEEFKFDPEEEAQKNKERGFKYEIVSEIKLKDQADEGDEDEEDVEWNMMELVQEDKFLIALTDKKLMKFSISETEELEKVGKSYKVEDDGEFEFM